VSALDPIGALAPVLEALRGLGVRHYVAGSLASSVHGVPRSSLDADVVAELLPHHAAPLVAALRGAFYVPEGHVASAIAERSSFNVIHLPTMLKVDIFVARDTPFDRRALDRARDVAVGTGGTMRVCSPEDTLLAKLEWYRRGGQTSERQWTDVIGLLRIGRDLDFGYLREGATELGVSDLLELAIAESGSG